MNADYDVFLSYARKDGEAVRALVEALCAQGLKVWFDERDIETWQDITAGIVDGLGHSRAMVAYYSQTYLQRRACQWELTAALLALQNPAERQRRILVVNPESESAHIHPAELWGALYARAPELGDAEGLRRTVSEIARRVGRLSGSLAVGQPLYRPLWLPVQRGSTRFVGRLSDLFEINRVLHGSDYPASSGVFGPGMAVVQGLGGIGKTLLVEEYALRFGSAYPGGIFWLSAPEDGASDELLKAELLRQLAAMTGRLLGQDTGDMDLDELKGRLAREIDLRGEACLWVVDDLPSGLPPEDVREWFSPNPRARTLITTRSRQYAGLLRPIQLGVLSPEDAYQLLALGRQPEGEAEEIAARGLLTDLGHHALGVAVVGAALAVRRGRQSFAEYRADLADPSEDELEHASQLVDDLPGVHGRSVAVTLLRSIRRLREEGHDLLRLASCLAPEPISPGLVEEVFRRVDGLGQRAARQRADQALHEAQSLSLIELMAESGDFTVHRLISRTVRFQRPTSERGHSLRAAAVEVLNAWLSEVGDVRRHGELGPMLPHARQLTAQAESLEDGVLLGRVALYDRERGAYASACSLYERQLELRRRLLGDHHPHTLTAAHNLGSTLDYRGQPQAARIVLEQTWEASQLVLGEDDPQTLITLHGLARTLLSLGELRVARVHQERLVEAFARLHGPEHPNTLTAKSVLAGTLGDLGELTAARALQQEVLSVSRRVLGEDHPETLREMSNLALTLSRLGDTDATRSLQEQVLETIGRVLGADHPDTLRAMNDLALTLAGQGMLEAARAMQEQVLGSSRAALGDEHPNVVWAKSNLAITLHHQGELAAARALHEQVLEIRLSQLGDEHPDTLLAKGVLASTLHSQGEFEAALDLQAKVLQGRQRVLGAEHPDTLVAKSNFAVTLAALNELQAAEALVEEVLEASVRQLGDNHPVTLLAVSSLKEIRTALDE